jgi:hypothetical protein
VSEVMLERHAARGRVLDTHRAYGAYAVLMQLGDGPRAN